QSNTAILPKLHVYPSPPVQGSTRRTAKAGLMSGLLPSLIVKAPAYLCQRAPTFKTDLSYSPIDLKITAGLSTPVPPTARTTVEMTTFSFVIPSEAEGSSVKK